MALWVSTGDWLPSVGCLSKPLNPNGICPNTYYRNTFFNGFKCLKMDGL